jgi:hypothetical protein
MFPGVGVRLRLVSVKDTLTDWANRLLHQSSSWWPRHCSPSDRTYPRRKKTAIRKHYNPYSSPKVRLNWLLDLCPHLRYGPPCHSMGWYQLCLELCNDNWLILRLLREHNPIHPVGAPQTRRCNDTTLHYLQTDGRFCMRISLLPNGRSITTVLLPPHLVPGRSRCRSNRKWRQNVTNDDITNDSCSSRWSIG